MTADIVETRVIGIWVGMVLIGLSMLEDLLHYYGGVCIGAFACFTLNVILRRDCMESILSIDR